MITILKSSAILLLFLSICATVTLDAHAADGVVEVTTVKDFKKQVISSRIPVLVDFFATWCGPCKRQGPIVESLARRYEGKVKFVKLDVDKVPDVAARYGVSGLPTLGIFKAGKMSSSAVGLHNKAELDEFLRSELGYSD